MRLFKKIYGIFRNLLLWVTGSAANVQESMDANKLVAREKFNSIIDAKKKIIESLKATYQNVAVATQKATISFEKEQREINNYKSIAEQALKVCQEKAKDPSFLNTPEYLRYKDVYSKATTQVKEREKLLSQHLKMKNDSEKQEENIKIELVKLNKSIDELIVKRDTLVKNVELHEAMQATKKSSNLSSDYSYLKEEEEKLNDYAIKLEVMIKNSQDEINNDSTQLENQLLEAAKNDDIFDEFDQQVLGSNKDPQPTLILENKAVLSEILANTEAKEVAFTPVGN